MCIKRRMFRVGDAEKIADLSMSELKCLLPNRYPYLLLDRVWEVVPGKSAKGYKNLTANEWFFPVHFPEEPVMPGVLQVETLLQALSLTVLALKGNAGMAVRGISADKIRLKRRVEPGKRLDVEAELHFWDGQIGRGSARGLIDGEEACSAVFEFMLFDPAAKGGEGQ